jgi:hypothetical protein
MRVSGRLFRIALACLTLCPLFSFTAAASDQSAAERVLGLQWRQLSRRAGMIFTGTVLSTGPRLAQAATSSGAPSKLHLGGDSVEIRFRIDRPIAGVESGQTLTIREWIGASSRQPALRSGERVLLFLYPPSRLGLTSPVGGAQGQIRLDSTGQNVAGRTPSPLAKSQSPHDTNPPGVPKLIPISQLERAIRAARGE